MNPLERTIRHIDSFQQGHRGLAFIVGVIKKFGDDRAGSLAALIAYYGFLAIFPLLLLLTTFLGFVMDQNSAIKRSVLQSALRDFPIIGEQLSQAIHPLRGNAFAVTFGVVGLVWGSLGVAHAGQLAMAEVWNIRGVDRPPFAKRLLRGFGLLAVLGLGLIATTVLAGLSTSDTDVPLQIAGVVLPVALNVGLFVLAFRVLTVRAVPSRDLLPGAIIGGICWSVLQVLGAYLVAHQLRYASQVYGYFASVLGLVSWLFLGAQVTLYAAEANVVWTRRLWPRSIVQPPLTDADKRAFDDIALQGERRPEQVVESTWTEDVASTDSLSRDSHPE